MKRRSIAMGVMVMISAGLLALSGCAGPEGDWALTGTWENPQYVGAGGNTAPRSVVESDLSFTAYDDLAGTTVVGTGSFEIVDEWTESGSHWFKVRATISGDANSPYGGLFRLFDGGNTYEGWSSMDATIPDPAAVERGTDDHSIMYREGS